MTGEMRGWERDELVSKNNFQAFLPHRDRQTPRPPYYLITTSCTEVRHQKDNSLQSEQTGGNEFARFDELTRRLLSVPKPEIDKKAAEHQIRKQKNKT
jgi:hypothetical protein